MGSKEVEEGQSPSLASIVRTAGKWVPTSELAPLVPLVGSSSFAENSIIMIAYDVNDALRQQLFPPERARGAAGPNIAVKSRTRPRDAKEHHWHGGESSNRIGQNVQAGATYRIRSLRFAFDPISGYGRSCALTLSTRKFYPRDEFRTVVVVDCFVNSRDHVSVPRRCRRRCSFTAGARFRRKRASYLPVDDRLA